MAERSLPAPLRAGVDHHRHVDIVEMALGDEFGLAEHELDLAAGDAAEPFLDVNEFLGRHREKDDLAGQMRGDLCAVSPIAAPSIPAIWALWPQLCAAPVSGIGERVVRGAQTVEFGDQGQPRPRHMPGEPALDPGQRQAGTGLEPQRAPFAGRRAWRSWSR